MRIVLWPKLMTMVKSFDELRKIDISAHTEKLGKYDYLPWLVCMDILRENGAQEVYYDHYDTLWLEVLGKKQMLVKVFVVIDGERRTITHPVALGEFSTDDPTARQVETAIHRGAVKCIAMNWGLGLDLWKNTDVDAAPMPVDNNVAIKLTMAFGAKVPEYGSADGLHKALGTNKAFFAKLISEGSKEDQQAMLEKIQSLSNDTF
jgi:Protein of unknown function (DUF1071)